MRVGILVTPYSTPRSSILPLLVSGESSSSSANASCEYLSSGEGGRVSTRDVRRGTIVRQGAHAEVVKRVSINVLLAEIRRRASWNWGGVRKGAKTRFFWEREGVVLNGCANAVGLFA